MNQGSPLTTNMESTTKVRVRVSSARGSATSPSVNAHEGASFSPAGETVSTAPNAAGGEADWTTVNRKKGGRNHSNRAPQKRGSNHFHSYYLGVAGRRIRKEKELLAKAARQARDKILGESDPVLPSDPAYETPPETPRETPSPAYTPPDSPRSTPPPPSIGRSTSAHDFRDLRGLARAATAASRPLSSFDLPDIRGANAWRRDSKARDAAVAAGLFPTAPTNIPTPLSERSDASDASVDAGPSDPAPPSVYHLRTVPLRGGEPAGPPPGAIPTPPPVGGGLMRPPRSASQWLTYVSARVARRDQPSIHRHGTVNIAEESVISSYLPRPSKEKPKVIAAAELVSVAMPSWTRSLCEVFGWVPPLEYYLVEPNLVDTMLLRPPRTYGAAVERFERIMGTQTDYHIPALPIHHQIGNRTITCPPVEAGTTHVAALIAAHYNPSLGNEIGPSTYTLIASLMKTSAARYVVQTLACVCVALIIKRRLTPVVGGLWLRLCRFASRAMPSRPQVQTTPLLSRALCTASVAKPPILTRLYYRTCVFARACLDGASRAVSPSAQYATDALRITAQNTAYAAREYIQAAAPAPTHASPDLGILPIAFSAGLFVRTLFDQRLAQYRRFALAVLMCTVVSVRQFRHAFPRVLCFLVLLKLCALASGMRSRSGS